MPSVDDAIGTVNSDLVKGFEMVTIDGAGLSLFIHNEVGTVYNPNFPKGCSCHGGM
jgi:hypothetical protein